jgi:hypothetical protein
MTNLTYIIIGDLNYSEIIIGIMNTIVYINNVIKSPIFINCYVTVGAILTIYGIINLSGPARKIGSRVVEGLGIGAAAAGTYAGVKDVIKDISSLTGFGSKEGSTSSGNNNGSTSSGNNNGNSSSGDNSGTSKNGK